MLLTLTGPLSLFVTVMVCDPLVVPTAWVAKVRLPGENVIGTIAVPKSPTICWSTPPLSFTTSAPFAEPTRVGANVTPMEQVAAGDNFTPLQEFALMEKFALIGNEEPRVRETFPLFFTVTVFAELVVPFAWFENVKVAGENRRGEAPAPDPVPDSPSS